MAACPSEGFVPEVIAKHQTLRQIAFSFENREKATRTIRRPTKPRSKDRLSSVCRCIGVRRSSRDLLNLLPLDFMRSEENTSELQSLIRISYAVFCLKKKSLTPTRTQSTTTHIN